MSVFKLKLLNNLVDQFFSNRANIVYQKFSQNINSNSNTILDYVLKARQTNFKTMYDDYYMGIEIGLTQSNFLDILILYSQIAYHSSANILAEADNLLFAIGI